MTQSKHFHVQGQVRRHPLPHSDSEPRLTCMQTVVIAGGSKGLGRELAIQLTTQGMFSPED